MSIFKAFFGLGKIPQVIKSFEFKSFDDVNKMGGAIAQIKQQVREGGLQLTQAQQKFLDDQMKQVEMVFEKIQQLKKETGIKSTQSAKIFDLQGQEIPQGSKIMGGKAIKETEAEIAERLGRENKKAVGNIRKKKLRDEISKLDDKIEARKLQLEQRGVEDFETDSLFNKLDEQRNDLELKLDFEDMVDPEDFAQGGRAGMLSGGLLSKGIMGALEQIKNMDEGNLFSKLDPLEKAKTIRDALTDRIKGFKNIIKDLKKEGRPIDEIEDFKFELDEAKDSLEKINEYIKNQPTNRTLQAQGGRAGFKEGEGIMMAGSLGDEKDDISREMFGKPVKDLNPGEFQELMEELERLREKFRAAQGGRAGFKDGMSRRKFMQIMGGLAALPIVGKFFKAGKVAAPAVEAVKETVTQAPPYFFDLVNKIKLFGKQSKVGPRERVNEFTYTGKDGSDYVMTEDIVTGDIKITKDKLGGANYGDMSYDTIEDRTEMVFRKGQMDESTKGKKPPNEYEEYKVEFDQDGTAADATDIDEISKMEIIKEVSNEAPSIKKAGGGIARMLGE